LRYVPILATAALLGLVACSEKRVESLASGADRVFLNGVVYTANANRDVASALAIRDGRIVYVGDSEGARALIGDDSIVVDMDGAMLLPGLHDMHIHPMGIIESDNCDLASEPVNLAQLAEVVENCIATRELPAGQWLSVEQWNFTAGNQPAGELRTLRQALDAAAPDNPVILRGNDGHHGAVNSRALARAVNAQGVAVGITAATISTDFAEYRDAIGVDASGEPNGELHETARDLVQPPPWGIIAGLGAERMPEVAAKLAANGITSIQDAATPPSNLPLYKSLVDSGAMSFRLSAAVLQDVDHFTDATGTTDVAAMVAQLKEIREAYRDVPYIDAGAAKIFVDGVIEGNPLNDPPTLPNAAVLRPYQQPLFDIDVDAGRAEITGYVDLAGEVCQQVRENPGGYDDPAESAAFHRKRGFYPVQCRESRGVLEHPASFVTDYVRALDAAGFRIHAHVIGDRAVRTALDSFEAARTANGAHGLRHSLGHIQLVAPEDYARVGKLGLYLVFTYAWVTPDFFYDLTVLPFIDRVDGVANLYRPDSYYMQNAYPVAQLQALGAILAGGSDAPVDTREPRPFVNIEQAVTRADPEGRVLNPAGAVDIYSALDAYTINGARLFGHEDRTGSLEVGKLADLVLIDQNLLGLAEAGRSADISETRVLLTLFEGNPVYEAP